MANKLKKMFLKSVDLVNRGANQEAHIKLHKSADYTDDVSKADDTANHYVGAFNYYVDVLNKSFDSIMQDSEMDQYEKDVMLTKSIQEFNETLDDYISSFDTVDKSYDGLQGNLYSKGEDSMNDGLNINKSLLSAEEATQLDALLAKAAGNGEDDVTPKKKPAVDPAGNKEVEEENLPPELKKAFDAIRAENAELRKSYEMRDLSELAKKYTAIGKKEEELAKTLYDMKQAGETVYKTYIETLDSQLELVNKSTLFDEIGKSANYNYSSIAKSEPEQKIEAIATELMKSDANLDMATAVAKAWEQNPDLMTAYETQFNR